MPYPPSLPSRGAWIEILAYEYKLTDAVVAPLAGSVDRNFALTESETKTQYVAPLAGSVDRNEAARHMIDRIAARRSPRGERG